MTTDEQLLSDILRDEADQITTAPSWDDVERRAADTAVTPATDRSARRRTPVVVWAGAAAAIVAVAIVLLVDRNDDDQGIIADDGTTVTEQAPSTTTTEPLDTPAAPATGPVQLEQADSITLPAGEPLGTDELVVVEIVDSDETGPVQQVNVVSTDGVPRRSLSGGVGASEGGILDLVLTPDRQTVLFVSSLNACEAGIMAVPADGSAEPVQIALGERVAISPEGTHIAFNLPVAHCAPDTPAIVVRELATGNSRGYGGDGGAPLSSLPPADPDDPETIRGLASLAFVDDTRLAFVASGRDGDDLVLLDVETAEERTIAAPNGQRFSFVIAGDGAAHAHLCCDPAGNPPASFRTLLASGEMTGGRPAVTDDVRDAAAQRGGSSFAEIESGALYIDGVEILTGVSYVAW